MLGIYKSKFDILEKQLKKATKEERQVILENIFFKKLANFSKGNISKAILYARNSAYNVKEKTVFIKPIKIRVFERIYCVQKACI